MGWLITAGILFLLAVFPLGVSACYDSNGAVVQAIAGPVRVTLFPPKKKAQKSKKDANTEAKSKAAPASEEAQGKAKAGGSWTDFLPLVRLALDFLGDFRRKLRVNRLEMKLILAGDDPAALGILYGRAWAALGSLWPQLERIFVIKKRDVQVECDFTSNQTLIFARMELSITFGRLIVLILRYGFRALKEYLKIRNQRKGGAAI